MPAIDAKGKRTARRWIAGVCFESGGDGHYYTDDGRFALFHMLRGTPHACWEIHSLSEDGRTKDLIQGDARCIEDLVRWGAKGQFVISDDDEEG